MMMKKFFTANFLLALLVLSSETLAQDSLFISELIDPSDDYTGRFIELYNAGSEPVDFSTTVCFLSRQSNGGTTWGDLQLTGVIEAGTTFVIGGSGFESLYGFAPDQVSGILIGNGDDAYALFSGGDHETGVLHDILGVIDMDGTGEPWEYTDSRAVRVESVRVPNPAWTATEWEISAANLADADPGTHLGSLPSDTILPGTYSLGLVNDTVTPGQMATVAAEVSALSQADAIISYQFDVDYDTTSLEYAGFTLSGTLGEGGTAVVNQRTGGRLSVGYMNTDPLLGAGSIILLQFTALVPDTSELLLSSAYLNTVPVSDLTPGTVIISEIEPPTAVITYDDTVNRFADTLLITATFSEPMSASSPVRLSMSGAVALAELEMTRMSERIYTYSYEIPRASGEVQLTLGNGTDLWGNPLVPEPVAGASFSIIGFNPGDVDDDGVILAYDAALVLQYSVGIDPLPEADPMPWAPWRDSTANVDGAAGITANDAGLILQYSAGMIGSFPAPAEAPASMAYVSHAMEDDHLVFYAHGKLIGLNLNATVGAGLLGAPELLSSSFMSAVNLKGSAYRLGLCTAAPVPDGDALFRIPLAGSGRVTLQLIENAVKREVSLDLLTSSGGWSIDQVEIFPNPARDILKIRGLAAPATIRISTIHGQVVRQSILTGSSGELHLTDLPEGLYLLTAEMGDERIVRRFIKE